MAKITLIPQILSIHGRIGNTVYYNVKGYQYARSHCIPYNPGTEAQLKTRTSLAAAVKLWQKLSDEEKCGYNRQAEGKPLTGYNIFISNTLKGIEHNATPAVQSEEICTCSIPDSCLIRTSSVPLSRRSGTYIKQGCSSIIILKKPPEPLPIAA